MAESPPLSVSYNGGVDTPLPTIEPVVISAPFGNYVCFEGSTPTWGTFTLLKRPGRLWRIAKTLRYYPRLGAWVNKIGLRNPGIEWAIAQVQGGKRDSAGALVSIHGFNDEEWFALLERADRLGAAGIELNMSCPNVGEVNWPRDLFAVAARLQTPVVVKVPPVRYERLVGEAIEAGLGAFHCSNTLPVRGGGMSGKPLMPVSLACVRDVRQRLDAAGMEGLVIGGGGISTEADVRAYADAGAQRFALGTAVLHPRYLRGPRDLRPVLDRAAELAR